MPTPDVSRLSNTLTDGVTVYQQVVYTTQDLASGFIERIPYFVAALIVLGIFWLFVLCGFFFVVVFTAYNSNNDFSVGYFLETSWG